jgi:pilus assembly protein FimV
VTIPVSDLDATTDQTITTSEPMADTAGGTVVAHTHMVTLTTANLATLKGGGSVTATSSPASDGHMHMFMVSCGAAATGTGGSTGAAGHAGAAGSTGAAGHTGAAGSTGAAGNTGAAGAH